MANNRQSFADFSIEYQKKHNLNQQSNKTNADKVIIPKGNPNQGTSSRPNMIKQDTIQAKEKAPTRSTNEIKSELAGIDGFGVGMGGVDSLPTMWQINNQRRINDLRLENERASKYEASQSTLADNGINLNSPNKGGSYSYADALLQAAAGAKGKLPKQLSNEIAGEIQRMRNENYGIGFFPDVVGLPTADAQRAQTNNAYLQELNKIPLSGAGNRVRAAGESIATNLLGAGVYAGEAIKKGFENKAEADAMLRELQTAKNKEETDAIIARYKGKVDAPVSNDGLGGKLLGGSRQKQQAASYGLSDSQKFLWDTGISTANYLAVTALTGGNAAFALGVMGTQAGAQQMYDAADRGVDSYLKQTASGIATGAIEAFTEKIPLEHAVKLIKVGGGTFRNYLFNLIKQAGMEGTEEMVNYAAGNIINKLILGDYADDFDVMELAKSAAMGALSGGFVVGIGSAPQSVLNSYNRVGKSVLDDMKRFDMAQTGSIGDDTSYINRYIYSAINGDNPSVRAYARELQTAQDNGKEIRPADIGRLQLLATGEVTLADLRGYELRENEREAVVTNAIIEEADETAPKSQSTATEAQNPSTDNAIRQDINTPTSTEDIAQTSTEAQTIEQKPLGAPATTDNVRSALKASDTAQIEDSTYQIIRDDNGNYKAVVTDNGGNVVYESESYQRRKQAIADVANATENGAPQARSNSEDSFDQYDEYNNPPIQNQNKSTQVANNNESLQTNQQTSLQNEQTESKVNQNKGEILANEAENTEANQKTGDFSTNENAQNEAENAQSNQNNEQSEEIEEESEEEQSRESDEDVSARKAKAMEIKKAASKNAVHGLADNEYSSKMSRNDRRVLDKIGKLYKTQIHLVDSIPRSATEGANGMYENGHIFIAADAENPMMVVLAHELTHHLERTAKNTYEKFQREAIASFRRSVGLDVISDAEFETFLQQTAERENLTIDGLKKEIAADYTENLIRSKQDIVALARVNSNLAYKVYDALRELINKLKAVVTDNTMLKELNDLERLWRDCFAEARANKNNLTILNDNSVAQYSQTSWAEGEREKALKFLENKGFEETLAKKWISNIDSTAALIRKNPLLDYKPNRNYKMLKKNQDYYFTLDSSTLCKKRLLYQGTFNSILNELNIPLSSDYMLAIRAMMKEAGLESPCGICYVESRRRMLGEYTRRWMEEIWYKFHPEDKPTNPKYNAEKALKYSDIMDFQKLEQLRIDRPEVYKAYTKWIKGRGVANPKLVEERTDYRGEIRKMRPSVVAKLNRIGGLRIHSFSDLETQHIIDLMQAVVDASAVDDGKGNGLRGQAYAKVGNLARVFGNTGIKINLSLVAKGVDKNGELIFDGKEGMDKDEAFALRKQFSKNVGTIVVCTTEEQVWAAMKHPQVDFIIPFHRSGWGESMYGILGLKGAEDFTASQNERVIDENSKDGSRALSKNEGNFYPIDYWDYSVDGTKNAETYLKMCAEANRIPKFSQFLVNNGDGSYSLPEDGSADGYWKMLIDFKMYDNDGVGAPQTSITPNFEMDAIEEIFNSTDTGVAKLPEAKEVVNRFVEMYRNGTLDEWIEDKKINSDDFVVGEQYSSGVAKRVQNQAEELLSLKAENKRIRKKLESAMKKLEKEKNERNVRTSVVLNKSDVKRVMRDIIDTYGGPVDAEQYEDRLNTLYTIFRNRLDGEDIKESDFYSQAHKAARALAKPIVDTAIEDVDEVVNELNDLKRKLKGRVTISDELKADPQFKEGLRAQAKGIIAFGKDGTPLDVLYGQLQEELPGLFPTQESQMAQLEHIIEIYNNLSNLSTTNPYTGNLEEMYDVVADDIIERYIDVKDAPMTYAERMQMRNDKLKDRIADLKADVKTGKIEKAQADAKIKELERDIAKNQREIERDAKKQKEANDKIAELKDNVKKLKSELSKAQSEYDALEKSNGKTQNEYQKALAQKDASVLANKAKIANLNEQISNLNSEIKAMEKEHKRVLEIARKRFVEDGNRLIELEVDKHIEKKLADAEIKRLKRESEKRGNELNRVKRSAEVQYVKDSWAIVLLNKKLKEVQQNRDIKLAELRAKNRETKKALRTAQKEREMRKRITKHAKDLSKKLLKPTDKQHIPEAFVGAVSNLLASINMESTYANDYLTGERIPRESTYLNTVNTKRTLAARALRKMYEEILAGQDDAPVMVVDPDVLIALDNIRDVPIASMSLEELNDLWSIIKGIEASISTANKMLGAQKYATVSAFANEIKGGVKAKPVVKEYTKVGKLIALDMLTPEGFMHRFGKGGDDLFKMLRKAQDKQITILDTVQRDVKTITKGVKIDKLEKEVHNFKFGGGTEFIMSTAQVMSLYCLNEREQARSHLLGGGFKPTPIGEGKLKKKQTRVKPISLGANPEDMLKEMFKVLTPEQIKLAQSLRDYMSSTMSKYGNEASMEVYGYKKFKEKAYFPIKVDSDSVAKDDNIAKLTGTIAGKGMAKQTVEGAKQPIMVDSIFDVFASHTSDMATYAAYLAPMENFNRIRRFKFKDDEGIVYATMPELIKSVYGQGGIDYINKLVTDINQRATGDTSFTMSSLMGTFKASAVAGNIRVILQQPTAGIRAMAMINPAYLLGGMVNKPLPTWKKVKKYAPIAIWKDWGYFDANTGRRVRDILYNQSNAVDKVKNATLLPIGAMDSLTWSTLWRACELEISARRKRRGASATKDDAFYKEVAERFNEIVDHTQVVDGILQRSQIMRSTDGVQKMATAFMSEPTKMYNMMVNALYDVAHSDKGSQKRKQAGKTLVATLFALVASVAANAAMQSFADAYRDDDRDKGYWDRWLKQFLGIEGDEKTKADEAKNFFFKGNLFNGFNLITYLPYAKDMWSVMQGFDVNRMDMESASNIIQKTEALVKSITDEDTKKTAGWSALEVVGEVARLVGIPLANIKRDVAGIYNTVLVGTDNYVGAYEFDKIMYKPKLGKNLSVFVMDMYRAREAGDHESEMAIYNDLKKNGHSDKDIEQKLITIQKKKEGVDSVEDLKDKPLLPGQQSSYDSRMKKIKSSDAWSKMDAEERKELEKEVYSVTVGVNKNEDYNNAKKDGLSDDAYFEYRAINAAYKDYAVGEDGKGAKSVNRSEFAAGLANSNLSDADKEAMFKKRFPTSNYGWKHYLK